MSSSSHTNRADQEPVVEVDDRLAAGLAGLAVGVAVALAADPELEQAHDAGHAAVAGGAGRVAGLGVAAGVVGHRAAGLAGVDAGEILDVVVGAAVGRVGGALGVVLALAAGGHGDDAGDLQHRGALGGVGVVAGGVALTAVAEAAGVAVGADALDRIGHGAA